MFAGGRRSRPSSSTPAEAETLINATAIGTLSLVLRSIADFNDTTEAVQASNQTIRVIRFGSESTVMTGNIGGSTDTPAAATVDPAVLHPRRFPPLLPPATSATPAVID